MRIANGDMFSADHTVQGKARAALASAAEMYPSIGAYEPPTGAAPAVTATIEEIESARDAAEESVPEPPGEADDEVPF